MDAGEFYSALGVVWVFGTAAVILVAWHLRGKRRLEKMSMIHQERMKALEKEVPLPEFPDFEEPSKLIVTSGNWNPRLAARIRSTVNYCGSRSLDGNVYG